MLAYHGTAERNLNSCLEHGIQPRGDKASEWEVPSRPDMTYMSIGYPFYYALQAAEDEKLLVFEIDLDRLIEVLLHPDEDFIAQALAQQERRPLMEVHDEVVENLEYYQHHWQLSLDSIGNVCYQGAIPPEAITRYCLFDLKQRPSLGLWMSDPSISILNFGFCKDKYVGLVDWVFGYREELPGDLGEAVLPPKYREARLQESRDRTGIEIRENN